MFLLMLILIAILGVSLGALVRWSKGSQATRYSYVQPPPHWPDIPVDGLGVFQRTGRINQARIGAPLPPRVTSFYAAQDMLLAQVLPSSGPCPAIALRLSIDGPDWTDVELDGTVIAQVPTRALLSHCC